MVYSEYMPTVKQNKLPESHWLDKAVRQLDAIVAEHAKLADEGDVLPTEWAMVSAKTFLHFVAVQSPGVSIPSFSLLTWT